MKFGEAFAEKYDLSTLKVLGTVGEPINPEAWLWYHKYVGSENCSIVDTYWQVLKHILYKHKFPNWVLKASKVA